MCAFFCAAVCTHHLQCQRSTPACQHQRPYKDITLLYGPPGRVWYGRLQSESVVGQMDGLNYFILLSFFFAVPLTLEVVPSDGGTELSGPSGVGVERSMLFCPTRTDYIGFVLYLVTLSQCRQAILTCMERSVSTVLTHRKLLSAIWSSPGR